MVALGLALSALLPAAGLARGTSVAVPSSAVPSGIGPVKIGLKRGPLRDSRGRAIRTVSTVLGAGGSSSEVEYIPVSNDPKVPFVPVYVTEYPSKGLSVYFQRVGDVTKKATGAKDKVLGVASFAAGKYGLPIGKTNPGGECIPADRHGAPDGGPRRVSACFVHGGKYGEILYMELNSSGRAGQRIAGVGVFTTKLEARLHLAMIEESKEGRDCEDLACE